MNRNLDLVFTKDEWLDKWGFVKMTREKPLYEYHCGTINGIYCETENGKDIIAIFNEEQHNGHFDIFLDQLEDYIDKTGETIAICAFMNEQLYWHLRNVRGYGNVASTMDRLVINGKKGVHNDKKKPSTNPL